MCVCVCVCVVCVCVCVCVCACGVVCVCVCVCVCVVCVCAPQQTPDCQWTQREEEALVTQHLESLEFPEAGILDTELNK